jgi:hypothetical protein
MLHAYVLNSRDIHVYNFFLIELWTYIYVYTNFVMNRERIYTYIPVGTGNPIGMGLSTKLNPSWVLGFLMSGSCIHMHGFEMAKPNGFVRVAISRHIVDGDVKYLYVERNLSTTCSEFHLYSCIWCNCTAKSLWSFFSFRESDNYSVWWDVGKCYNFTRYITIFFCKFLKGHGWVTD